MKERIRDYTEFQQRVRRHRPSDLLPLIARTSIATHRPDVFLKDRLILPWGLAAAAKESIRAGNEHRPEGVTSDDIQEICASFNSLRDPLLKKEPNSEPLRSFFVRISFEQFPYQQSIFEEMARVYALLGDLPSTGLRVLSSTTWQELLGCSLLEFVGAGFLFSVGAEKNDGYFDLAWLGQDNFKPIVEEVPADVIRHTLREHFGAPMETLKQIANQWTSAQEEWRRFDFNPLKAHPFVHMPDGRYLAPIINFVSHKISAESLFYTGMAAFGEPFSEDIGVLLQDYVGQQLELTKAHVIPEIVYDKGQKRSADWFLVFPDLVVIIEVKSTRLTQGARAGGPRLDADLDRAIGKAFDQISTTEARLQEAHPDFSQVPKDRRRVALTVTLEPYWAANSKMVREILNEPPIPTMVCSIRDLEHYCSLAMSSDGAGLLTDILDDEEKRTWGLGNALPSARGIRNPILDAAWDKYPWGDRMDRPETAETSP